MDWRAKAFAHTVFSALPGGHRINYLAQRMLTQSLPVPDDRFTDVVIGAKRRFEQMRAMLSKPVDRATFYEIGAGWDLQIPLLHWSMGVEKQVLVDIRPLVTAELVNDSIERLGRMRRPVNLQRRPVHRVRDGKVVEDLERHYGIRTIAPCDAKDTHLPSGSMDVISSTNTFEHIRGEDILPILQESKRLLAPGGVLCLHIDHQDHYAFTDPSITPFNFLRYSDRTWSLVNPPLHHQNRLRHKDFMLLYEAAGFDLLHEETTGPRPEDIEAIRALPLDKRFRGLDPSELAVRTSTVVLARRGDMHRNMDQSYRTIHARGAWQSQQALPTD